MPKSDVLRRIVENAQCDPEAFGIIRRHATGILVKLGVPFEKADEWLMKEVKDKKVSDLHAWEGELHSQLSKLGVYNKLSDKMKERAGEWFDKIRPYLLKSKTLDLGGGSGEVAMLMQKHGRHVSIADVLNWSRFDLPFIQVKDNKMTVKDGEFDQVVLLTVFHHTDDPSALVKEAFRVAKKRVIFIESVTENQVGFAYGAWVDWFYNRVVHYSKDPSKKINVPCNFTSATGWEQLVWKLTGLKPKYSVNLGIFQYLNPENHHLFVYEK